MADEPLRHIHVGTGGRGGSHVRIASGHPDWQAVALVDIDENALESARERTGLGRSACFATLAEAIKAVEADATIISTPTATHAPFARIAFDAGLHVLVEKGMTTHLSLAKELVEEADESGVKFCVAQNYRYHPHQRRIKEILDSRGHGAPQIVDLIHHRYRPNPRTLNYLNAMIWDMSCHHFDNLNFWFGPARTVVSAKTFNPPWSKYAYDSGVYAILEYESGMVCNYGLTHCAQIDRYHLLIQTDRGSLRTYDVEDIEFQPLGGGERETIKLPSLPPAEEFILNDFRDYIREGIEPGISGRRNLRTLALCEATCMAAEGNGSVAVEELLAD